MMRIQFIAAIQSMLPTNNKKKKKKRKRKKLICIIWLSDNAYNIGLKSWLEFNPFIQSMLIEETNN